MRNLLVGLVLAAVVVGAVLLVRGGKHRHVPATTPGRTIALRIYVYRGAALAPVVLHAPATKGVARAALETLLKGAARPYRTTIPAGTALSAVTIANGIATADFSSRMAAAPRTAQAQVVYTLTQFASVRSVVIQANGAPLRLRDGSGRTLLRAATRADYADLTPDAPIFVESPLRDATVTSPVRVSGTATVFEATFALELWSSGHRLRRLTVTASAGAPERGSWSRTLTLAPGSYRLVAYEPSAENGDPLHSTTVDFRVKG
jgi:hypothetical protein